MCIRDSHEEMRLRSLLKNEWQFEESHHAQSQLSKVKKIQEIHQKKNHSNGVRGLEKHSFPTLFHRQKHIV